VTRQAELYWRQEAAQFLEEGLPSKPEHVQDEDLQLDEGASEDRSLVSSRLVLGMPEGSRCCAPEAST
jgi:hypothetical protein